ncbi:MAG: OmpH family outer membrane protein [Flavobacteriales bacterium]
MKNESSAWLSKLTLALSAIAFVGMIFLFVRSSSSGSSDFAVADTTNAFNGANPPKSSTIAFVMADSLQKNCQFIVSKTKSLEAKMKAAEEKVKREYGARQRQYEQNMRYFQEHPEMPETEAMALQQEMEKLQSELDQIQQREVGSVEQEQVQLQDEIEKMLNEFLAEYCKQKEIDYVFNRQSGIDFLLFGNPTLDVTQDVIAGLNAKYPSN